MKKAVLCLFMLMALMYLSGCGALPVEEATFSVVLENVPDVSPIRTAVVERGDVLLVSNPGAVFVTVREEELLFEAPAYMLSGVTIAVGDYVYEGEIIAELYEPNIAVQLEELRWEEEWLSLALMQITERHNLALEQATRTGIPVDDSPYLEERARLLNEQRILNMRLENQFQELENLYIRAPFDGVITQALFTTASGTGHAGLVQVAILIADQSQFIFRMIGPEANYMIPGMYFDMQVLGGHFIGRVIDPVEYGIDGRRDLMGTDFFHPAAYLLLVGEMPEITGSAFATVRVVAAEARDVLFVPNLSVSRVGDRDFVYVVEDDTRVIRYVEIGLIGNAMSEIVSGLYEGEHVVY